MLKYFLTLLLALILVSCGACVLDTRQPQDSAGDVRRIHFHGDPAFTPAERKEIELAMDTWAGATSGLALLTVQWDLEPGHQILRVDDLSGAAVGRVSVINFGAYPRTMWISADECNALGVLREVVIHELGHAMGLTHVEDQAAIMSAVVGPGQNCLNSSDMEEYCRVNKCGTTKIYACDRMVVP